MNGRYEIGDIVMKNWTIGKKLGEGSFGRVYEIEREDFGETYTAALKVITVPQSDAELQVALEEMSPEAAESYFYGVVEEIVREFALMAKVKGTAHVVSYEDHEVIRHEQGIGWDILIRMEELTPLSAYARLHPFTRRDVIRLGIHMCQGLELCQKYNIIHRDLKPDNIFVSGNGDFKLGDFGIARTVEKTMSGLSKKGTYNYMAPEVYKGQEYGFSVDLYSLGIVMYRLLNKNRLPFLPPAPQPLTYSSREQALARRMNGDAMPTPCFGSGKLWEIVRKAAAYLPKERYASPAQMCRELEAVLAQEPDGAIIYPEEAVSQEMAVLEAGYGAESLSQNTTEEIDGMAGHAGKKVPDKEQEQTVEKTVSIFDDTAASGSGCCTHCGSPMEEGALFCTMCGAKNGPETFPGEQSSNGKQYPDEGQISEEQRHSKEDQDPGRKKVSRKKKGVLAVVLLLVVAVAGGILCYMKLSRDRKEPVETNTLQPSPSPSPTQTPTASPSPTGQPQESPEPSDQEMVIAVPGIADHVMEIEAIVPHILEIRSADFLSYSGNMSKEKQMDTYTFEAPYDGIYRVNVDGMSGAMEVNLYADDAVGTGINTSSRCSNGQGMTVAGLSAGETYQIRVRQHTEYGSYSMTVGLQKEPVDITALTGLTDSVEFEDQCNVYTFTAPRDGRYRFEFSEMMGNVAVGIYVYNHLEEMVASESRCFNGQGVTVYEMTAGETYQIQVRQKEELGSYILSVGQQKETADISDCTAITDFLEYTEQKNMYLFTVPLDGRYRFELSGMTGGTEAGIYVFNELKESVDSEGSCSNGQGLTLKGLTAGETYWIQVRQKNGFGAYTLSIGQQKETVQIKNGSVVTDSVEYTDQRNVYAYTADRDGDVTFGISEMTSGTMVELYVFNDLGEEIVSLTRCYNGDSVVLQGVTTGTYYEVQVRQREGTSSYRMDVMSEAAE